MGKEMKNRVEKVTVTDKTENMAMEEDGVEGKANLESDLNAQFERMKRTAAESRAELFNKIAKSAIEWVYSERKERILRRNMDGLNTKERRLIRILDIQRSIRMSFIQQLSRERQQERFHLARFTRTTTEMNLREPVVNKSERIRRVKLKMELIRLRNRQMKRESGIRLRFGGSEQEAREESMVETMKELTM